LRNFRNYSGIIVIFLIIVSCIAFGRIVGNDFINYDDNVYVTENNHVQSGMNPENIRWAFTTVVSSNWHPLTLITHMLDWSLFGANPSGHHLVSLLLHIGAVIFLFLFLNKTTKNIWPSAFAAALFAIHPLRVESVAWIAERKDVLSMFFGMASIYLYAFYAERPKCSLYLLSLILFALALMSKPMLVTLPFVLMLLDYWPLGRWKHAINKSGKVFNSNGRLIWEKTPYILLTIISGIITFWAQNKGGSLAPTVRLPFLERVTNAIVSYSAYLGKFFWPVNLSVFYPYDFSIPLSKVFISGIIIILVTVAVLYYIRKLPFLFVGWFWYLGTLIPVIGLVQVGTQAMADRYTYLPSIGIAIMLAWSIHLFFKQKEMNKKKLIPLGMAVIIGMAVLTWQQCGYWKNSVDLFGHSLEVIKNNYLAYNHRGMAYGELGYNQFAINDFSMAIRIRPHDVHAYYNRGVTYDNMGLYQNAIEDYTQSITYNPNAAGVYNNRAISYFKQGNKTLFCLDIQKACDLGNCRLSKFAKDKGICR
jgi:protein O-mannosyl-transferase